METTLTFSCQAATLKASDRLTSDAYSTASSSNSSATNSKCPSTRAARSEIEVVVEAVLVSVVVRVWLALTSASQGRAASTLLAPPIHKTSS